jgi:enterochelin esterase-like enzyme
MYKIRLGSLWTGMLLFWFMATTINAQQTPPTGQKPATPNPAMFRRNVVVSPEILPDNKVTFRLYAPNALVVNISGTWMPGYGKTESLIKNDTGLWAITLGPLNPEFYGYTYNVDGVKTLDPSNSRIRRDGVNYENILAISGKESDLYSVKDIPHGVLSKVWYKSPVLGMTRRMYVYTPADYAESKTKYPVLYLLHGAGGDEDAWTTMGNACQIMDNLIAQGKSKPMIVVMTNGNPLSAAAPNEGPVNLNLTNPPTAGPNGMASGKFEESLVKDVVPFIEKNYRTLKDKDNRAIAGLSMGGLHTQNITFGNPTMFSYIGVMSMGIVDWKARGVIMPEVDMDAQAEALKKSGVKLYWVGVGKEDFLYKSVEDLRKFLDKHQFKYIYRESSGGHTWANWRIYLSELAPMLFK